MTAPEPLRLTLEEARRRHDAAREELGRLCHGGRFRMTIPAQPDDSDTIFGGALRALRSLIESHELVPRDDTAELVEAVEEYLTALDAWSAEPFPTHVEKHQERQAAAEASLRAALARVKGGER